MKYYQNRKYLNMVINGLASNYDYLGQYLKREQKKAEKEHIDFSEFIGRTLTVVKDLERECFRVKNDLEAKKNGANDKIIDEQINKLMVPGGPTMPLEHITNGDFKGNLRFWDVSKFRDAINEVFDFYSIEKEIENNEPTEYFQEKKVEFKVVEEKINTGPSRNPYPEVFISLEAFLLFEKLYHKKKDSSTILADFSFIYRKMEKDSLLQDHQKPEVFRKWLSKEPYKVVLDNKFKTIDNCTTRAKEDSYLDAKQLIQKQPQ